MIRLAGHIVSLFAAAVLTLAATAALTGIGSYADTRPLELIAPSVINISRTICPGPPTEAPPLPRFIHPHAVNVRTPQIVCEVPGDPAAVTDCAVPDRAR